MSGHADTIRAMLPTRGRTTVWWSGAESEAAHASLDALLAENQRLREALERIAVSGATDSEATEKRLIAREALAGDTE